MAILREDIKIIEILLSHGANPNFKDSKGITPLEFAKKLTNPDIYNLLIYHGAIPDK